MYIYIYVYVYYIYTNIYIYIYLLYIYILYNIYIYIYIYIDIYIYIFILYILGGTFLFNKNLARSGTYYWPLSTIYKFLPDYDLKFTCFAIQCSIEIIFV